MMRSFSTPAVGSPCSTRTMTCTSRLPHSWRRSIRMADQLGDGRDGQWPARTSARSLFVNAVRVFAKSARCRIVEVDQDLRDKALDMYADAMDKTWGLIDCASFLVMKKNGILEALTPSFSTGWIHGAVVHL